LNAIVDNPRAVNQIPITGQAAKKKCNERELLKEAYWKIKRPKSVIQKVSLMPGLSHLPLIVRESGALAGY
jgi:hypothetical protein